MIIGHQRILDFFKKSIKNNRLAHAYLFIGPNHLGKKTVALELIRMLTGDEIDTAVHPDIIIAEPETIETDKGVKKESEISIKKLREIQHQLSMFPYRASYKIALIDQADKMTSQASNCLLKTLEEPKSKTILILISSNSEFILPTIISRCQTIKFLSVKQEEIEKGLSDFPDSKKITDKKLNQIIRLANGRPGLAIQYIKNPELLENQKEIIVQLEKLLKSNISERYNYIESISKNIIETQNILSHWLFWFRDLLLLTINCPDLIVYEDVQKYNKCYSLPKLKKIIQKIKETKVILDNPSFNARLALEVLMLEF